MADFKDLIVWQRAHGLALTVYRAAAAFPRDERFELSAQVRRAAVSIPANIAEGAGRFTGGDQARFYRIAIGSARELEALLYLSRDLGFASEEEVRAITRELDEVQRMLMALDRRARARPSTRPLPSRN